MPLTALRPTLLGAFTPALALLLGLASDDAGALGLGRPLVHSALGKPLDVSVPLVLADGEQLSDSCLRAEVMAGDARVPAGLLQLRIEGDPGQQRIRLQSLARIDEPALRLTLALGCPLRLTREFNLLVDPAPGTAATPAPLPVAAPSVASAPAPAAQAEPRPQAEARKPPPARPRVRPKPRSAGPRLVMERPEVLVADTPRPAAQGGEAGLTPELEAQISQLEQTVAQLRAELEARQQAQAASAAVAAPAVVASAPAVAPPAVPRSGASPYRDPLAWLLTLGVSLLAGAAAFYGSRWRDERSRRELAYWRALHAAEGASPPPQPAPPPSPGMAPPVAGAAAALPDEGQHQVTRPQPRPMTGSPLPAAMAAFSMQATQPLPVHAGPATEPVAQLTVADQLLDLQQQVEFLQLLGQHEAVADLLTAQLAAGDAGAMPYLLLMEQYQQQGQADAFAELAGQFERRLQTMPPHWAQSLSRGRSLDASPTVIAHLQVVWSEPAAAMQMLQELLARGGGPGTPHFELPALRDLLLLYSIARDLFEAGLRSDEVDLMLPLEPG